MATPSQSKVLDGTLRSNGAAAFVKVGDAVVADAALDAGQITLYLDEGANKLIFKAKYANGTTVKTHELALT